MNKLIRLMLVLGTAMGLGCSGEDQENIDNSSDFGTVEQAVSTFSHYGQGQSPAHMADLNGTGRPDDNQCYGDVPCQLPADRIISFKPAYGLQSFVFNQGLSQAISYMQSMGGSNWTVNLNGTQSSEQIFSDTVCGVGAKSEFSQISSVHTQNGWRWYTAGRCSIRVCTTTVGQSIASWTEAQQIAGWRDILAHEIGHCMGLAHNPASALMNEIPMAKTATSMSAIEQSELLSYIP